MYNIDDVVANKKIVAEVRELIGLDCVTENGDKGVLWGFSKIGFSSFLVESNGRLIYPMEVSI
jgi:hypothetical protein